MDEASTPTVSVVIPLFNKRMTIERALCSVTAQAIERLEIVVVDDGGHDGSREIVESLAIPNLRLIRQTNGGPGSARNTGVAAARAPVIAFLDADDEWLPGHLDAALNALQASGAVAYACGYDAGRYRSERPNKIAGLGKTAAMQPPPHTASSQLLKAHVDAMHSSCVVVRKEHVVATGGFFDEDGCRFGEDSWLWGHIVLAEPIYWDPAERVRFHVEDSDLGYATTSRKIARPITRYPARFLAGVPEAALPAGRRLIHAFATLDYHNLVKSRSWVEAARMRSLHRLNGKLGWLKEVRYRVRAASGRPPWRHT